MAGAAGPIDTPPRVHLDLLSLQPAVDLFFVPWQLPIGAPSCSPCPPGIFSAIQRPQEWSSTNEERVRGSIPQLSWPSLGKFGSSGCSFTRGFLEGQSCRCLSGVVIHLVLAFFPSSLIHILRGCFLGSTSEWLTKPSLVSGSAWKNPSKNSPLKA